MAIQAGIKEKLIIGEIPFEKWPAVLSSAEACVVTTLREGLGLSVIEALALDVPVVATDAPGITEVIENGVSGLLYPIGEPNILAQLLLKVIREPKCRRNLIEGGAAVVRNRFRAQDMARKHSALYRTLLNQSNPPSVLEATDASVSTKSEHSYLEKSSTLVPGVLRASVGAILPTEQG